MGKEFETLRLIRKSLLIFASQQGGVLGKEQKGLKPLASQRPRLDRAGERVYCALGSQNGAMGTPSRVGGQLSDNISGHGFMVFSWLNRNRHFGEKM